VGGRDRGVRPPEPSTHQPYQTVAHDPYAAFPSPYSAPAALRVLGGGGGAARLSPSPSSGSMSARAPWPKTDPQRSGEKGERVLALRAGVTPLSLFRSPQDFV